MKTQNYEIAMELQNLRQEVEILKLRHEDLSKAVDMDRTETIRHISSLHKAMEVTFDQIEYFHDYFWPIVRKVFPQWDKDIDRMSTVIQEGRRKLRELGGKTDPEK